MTPAEPAGAPRRVPWVRGLTFKQAAITFGVALLFTVLSSGYALYAEWRKTHQDVQRQKEEMLTLLRRSATEALKPENAAIRRPLLDGLLANPLVVYVDVTRPYRAEAGGAAGDDVQRTNGDVVLREYRPRIPKYGLSEEWGERLFGDVAVASSDLYEEQDGQRRSVGQMNIVLSQEIMADRFFDRARDEVLLAMVREFLIALVIVALFYWLITRPLVRVAGAVARVDPAAPGAWQPPPMRFHRRDELGQVVDNVNRLMQQFQAGLDERNAAQRALESLNLGLEQRVEQRTAELREAFERLDQAHGALSRANAQVLDSIQYARRIQLAMLPDRDALKGLVRDLDVWWEPLHSVGGDFYALQRFGEPGREQCLLFVADCTGHGVPGAFITLVVSNALEQLLRGAREGRLLEPAELLQAMDRMVRKRLHQNVASSGDDGFDAALCLWEPAARRLRFAAAGLTVLLQHGGQLREVRGLRGGLGYAQPPKGELLTHTAELRPGDSVYLHTDGVTDQMGQASRVLFGRRRMMQQLQRDAHAPMAEQRLRLQAALAQWRGLQPLRDDLTWIGWRPL
jgi:serine phosphatase RsbU (regulator of sigma subunit)